MVDDPTKDKDYNPEAEFEAEGPRDGRGRHF